MLTALKQKRMERGLRQWDVAKQLGVNPATISQWENRHAKPSQEQLRQLAELYEVEVGELLDN